LVYVSKAVVHLDKQQLLDLVARSQEKNTQSAVTGILLVSNGYFFQMLEGEESVVRQLFERIKLDKRHEQVALLLAYEVRQRRTPTWDMLLLISSNDNETQANEKINALLALAEQDYQQKEQILSDLFCQFMTPLQQQSYIR
jgi:hypothetical protein